MFRFQGLSWYPGSIFNHRYQGSTGMNYIDRPFSRKFG